MSGQRIQGFGVHNRFRMQNDCVDSGLHAAVRERRRDAVQALLNQPDTKINECTRDGRTSLWLACDLPHRGLAIARDLLAHGADPNIPDDEGVSPLHAACSRGKLEHVKLLLRHQVDINCQDCDNFTPLHYAIVSSSPDIVEHLLEQNADANLPELGGMNALTFSLRHGRSYVDLLLPYTSNLNAVTRDGWTALLFAIHKPNAAAMRTLLTHGASLTAHTCPESLLALAVRSQNFAVFEMVWRRTDAGAVSAAQDLMRLVCQHCPLPACYEIYELVLSTPGIELHLDGASGLFSGIFKNIPPPMTFNTSRSQYLAVFGWLLGAGVQLDTSDLEQVLWYFAQCPYSMEVWQAILARTTPDIGEAVVREALRYESYDVALLLATYCLQVTADTTWGALATCVGGVSGRGPHSYCLHVNADGIAVFSYGLSKFSVHLSQDGVIDFTYGLNTTCMRTWLALFTPTGQHRQEINRLPLLCHFARARQLLDDTPPVKSLRELARDAAREALRASCRTSRDFVAGLRTLDVPMDVLDIIRLRVPMNRHLLAVVEEEEEEVEVVQGVGVEQYEEEEEE